jgi:hypothetical protein
MDHPTGIFTISKDPPSTPAQDFAFLRKRMFELLEQLASGVWTDYNAHDPGITIGEAVCFAITELAMRVNLPVDQLLGGNNPDALMHAFSPERALPNHPVNGNDFRTISRGVGKIKNAWLLKSPVPEVPIFIEEKIILGVTSYSLNVDAIGSILRLQGLFDVYFELSDSKLNTNLLLVNAGTVGIPAIDPVLGPITELYWMELGLPYWDQFPVAWQKPIALNGVTINSSLHDPDANVFTAGVKVDYDTIPATLPQTHSFGIVIRATALTTSFATVAQIQAFINGSVLPLLAVHAPYAALNQKIIDIGAQSNLLQNQLALHRNLCQDFLRFRSIRIQEIAVKASIELPLPYSIEEICADLFFRLDNFFSPPLQFNSLEELLAEGFSISEIYDGPVNEKGFMRPGIVERDWTKGGVFTSDLMHELLAINDQDAGLKRIIAILDFSINSFVNNYPLVTGDRNCVTVIQGSFYRPVFTPIKSDFKFFHEGSEIPYNKEVALQLFISKKNAITVGVAATAKLPVVSDLAPLNLGEYYSVQNDFPAVYGIGHAGLPGDASVMRQGQANQLKGYLLLFDQLLANTSAQVGQLQSYFSFDPAVEHTYFFHSLLNVVPGINDLLVNSDPAYEQQTALLLEDAERFLVRRNRFQDHMLSIVGEDLSEYESVLLNFYARKAVVDTDLPILRQEALERLVEDKNRVLRELPELSAGRGLGFSLTDHIELFFDTVAAQWKWKLFNVVIIAAVETKVDLLISVAGFASKRAAFDHLVQHLKEFCSVFYYHLNPAIPSFIEVRDKHVPDATSTVLAVSPDTFATPPTAAEVIKAKAEILNIVHRIWHSPNVSGLEKRAGRFLGFHDYRRRNLVDVNFLQYFNIRAQAGTYAFILEHEELPFKLETTFSYASHAAAEADLAATVLNGMNEIKYTTAIGPTTITITLQNGAASPPTFTIPINNNPGPVKVISRFVEFFKEYFGPQEGCFMVEHLLIRPRIKSIAPPPSLLLTTIGTEELPAHDPYSNRFVSFLLEGELAAFPGHSSRLSDGEFKKLTAKIFRQEAPAHLIGHFKWLNEADMTTLQDLYRAWIALLFTTNAIEDAFADIQSDLVDFVVLHLQT